MPTQPEVLAIEEAHRAAQARLGIAGAYLAIRDWNSVSATAAAATADQWLSRNLQMLRAIQRKSGRLAKAYYQLARAIETGYSLGLPETSADPEQVTMGDLRKQFLDLMLEIADIDKPTSASSNDSDERWLEDELRRNPSVANPLPSREINLSEIDSYIQDWLDAPTEIEDKTELEIDDFDWLDFSADEDRAREELEKQLLDVIDTRTEKVVKIADSEELSAKEAQGKIEKLHGDTGSIVAGLIDQAGMDAGRNILGHATRSDRRALMIARMTGPNPCAFCSMLASRGFVYRSARGAILSGNEIEKYHPNCHCFAVTRWADIPDPTAPGRAQFYMDAWEREVGRKYERRGTSNDALNQWRRFIYKENRARLNRIRQDVNAGILV